MSEVGRVRKVYIKKISSKVGGKLKEEKITPSSPIGIFDSGVGGLTVFRQIMKKLPCEDVIYLADTARVPYGGRSREEIIKINHETIPFLIKNGAKMIIMACGTSSSIAYPVVKDEYSINIVSLIEPGANAAVRASQSGKIGVIATAGTINSHSFQNKINELNKDAQVHAVGCPLFVPLIEGGFTESDEVRKVAKEYLKPLLKEKIDTLILGCTHYPHLSKILQEIAGAEVKLIDPAEEAVQDTKRLLEKAKTLKPKTSLAKYEFYVTGSVIQFQDLGSRLLGKPIIGAKQVTLS